jgi:hypothetical protein
MRSIECTTAPLTQIFKMKVVNMRDRFAVEESWRKLVHLNGVPTVKSFHGWGRKNVEGEFLGMIGWESQEVSYVEWHLR